MSNLSQILADSNWGQESARINQNFQNINTDLEKVKSSTTKFKGYFTTEESLKNKFGSPKEGDTAWVGEPYPGTVYDVQTDGQWHNTGKAPDTGSVDLQDYAKKAELTELEGKVGGVGYVTCDTAAGTAAKVITVTGLTVLSTGIRLLVKMTNNNTASNATLNINGLGAKPLYYNNTRVSGDNTWEAGEIVDIYYDGTNFYSGNFQGGSGEGGNLILEWNTDAATTRKQVKQSDRKSLLQISYKDSNGNPVNEQYIGNTFTDTEWEKDSNWSSLANYEYINTVIELNQLLRTTGYLKEYNIQTNKYINGSGELSQSSQSDVYEYNVSDIPDNSVLLVKGSNGAPSVYPIAALYDSGGILISTFMGNNNETIKILKTELSAKLMVSCKHSNDVSVTKIEGQNYIELINTLSQKISNTEQTNNSLYSLLNLTLGLEASPVELGLSYYGFYNSASPTPNEKWYTSRILLVTSENISIVQEDGTPAIMRIYEFDEYGNWVRRIASDSKADVTGVKYIAVATSAPDASPSGSGLTLLTEEEFKKCKINGAAYIASDKNEKSNISVPNHGITISEQSSITLIGASFAYPSNGWFELACEKLGITPINLAVSGSSIITQAQKYKEGTLWTKEQFEESEALIIMHVHNQNVAVTANIKDDYNDYTSFDYATAYDYVIRKYIDDCYNLKNDETSKYYNSREGKPCQILLMTHWHDAREIFNNSIRELSIRWNIPLVELDKNIGFTKDKPFSDGKQVSIIYAVSDTNTEIIDGITYGWHPKTGKESYIQRKIADIFKNYIHVL